MDSKQLLIVIIVAIAASAITAFITVNLTGAVIKVPAKALGSGQLYDVYTKGEVDKILGVGKALINAAECIADKVYEVNGIYIKEERGDPVYRQ